MNTLQTRSLPVSYPVDEIVATSRLQSATKPHKRDSLLAIQGGLPLRTQAFPEWPSFSNDEVRAVTAVLHSGKLNYWTGQECRKFEAEFATFTGCEYAISVANGTVALELAIHALEIGEGDEVIVPCRTFVASASCVVMRGATPVFADVDRVSQTLTAETVRKVLSPRTRAIIAVHLAGWPCDMDPILELARERGIKVIEDCAQAHGATYKGRPVGSLGQLAAFSFCQDKIITTGGEGGMLTTNDNGLWKRAWSFKDHGKNYCAASANSGSASFRWLHDSIGTNWRLTEMQAAIGRSLLRKLPDQRRQRRRNAQRLDACFSALPPLRVTVPNEDCEHAYYKYYVFLRPEWLRPGWDREAVTRAIAAEGIPCFCGSCSEIYMEEAFPISMRPEERLPTAMELGQTSLMLLVHPTLTDEDMIDTVYAVQKVLRVAAWPFEVEVPQALVVEGVHES